VQGRHVVVALDGPRRFRLAKASAMLGPGQNRFVALRQFELYSCTAGGAQNPTCDGNVDAGWRRILRSRADAFPGINPRPVAPELNLRAFNVPTTTATHVKFVVLNNQCTGQPSFQGRQDRDPRHETDCRIGTPLPARNTEVRAAELQLLSSRPQVKVGWCGFIPSTWPRLASSCRRCMGALESRFPESADHLLGAGRTGPRSS
jgi:extracellular elastinolytic metalloproteinase